MTKAEQRAKLVKAVNEDERALVEALKAWVEAEKTCEKAEDAWEYDYDTLVQFDKES